jgi:hypothetical protein
MCGRQRAKIAVFELNEERRSDYANGNPPPWLKQSLFHRVHWVWYTGLPDLTPLNESHAYVARKSRLISA